MALQDESSETDADIFALVRDAIKSLVSVKSDATLNDVAAICFHMAVEAAKDDRPIRMTKIIMMGGNMLECGAIEILEHERRRKRSKAAS